MNTKEFSNEFDILYDNISSNAAPGLNQYEKSVFLTKAQEEIISQYYSGFNNQLAGFEGNEDIRRGLSELVKTHKNSSIINSTIGISINSKFISIPNNLFYIVFEQVTLISDNSCINGKKVMVKPITHDEYNISKDNPFRKPNNNKVWRLDIAKLNNLKVIELISTNNILEYFCRYIEKPSPIILVDFELDDEIQGMNLTIDGENTLTECKLNSEIHREILNRAVEMAIRTYRENTLQSNVQLNKNKV